MSSLDAKDAVADYSTLTEAQRKTLDQWDSFFAKVGGVGSCGGGNGDGVHEGPSAHHMAAIASQSPRAR